MSGEHTGDEYSLDAAVGKDDGAGGVPAGELLNEFVEAVCTRDENRMDKSRKQIADALGEIAMVDTAAVIAAFNGYPRAADATGIPLEDYKEEVTETLREELGLNSLNLSKTA